MRRFVGETGVRFPEVNLREARRREFEHAVVVDTSSTARLGEVWDLIRTAGCRVTLIDHHTEEPDDLKPAERVTRHVGATCTLIAELFQQRGLAPTPEEASLLLMGLHEDTGSFSYRDTTGDDLRAAGWLLEQGASLSWVRRWVTKALDPDQLGLLNRLVENSQERSVNGTPVVVSMVETDRYTEEAAFVVHRWVQIFELPVGAALFVRPPHIGLILRSRLAGLDVGEIARAFGGGGHATAASARVTGRVAVEVREELWRRLGEAMPPGETAGGAAARKIFTVDDTVTVVAARTRANQLRVNALPVADETTKRLVGVVTRQLLDRAEGMGLGHRPVSSVMTPGVPTVAAETPLTELRDVFLQGSHRFVIVARDGEPVGILTRMELFRRLFERQAATGSALDRRMAAQRPVTQSVTRLLREGAPEWVAGLLAEVRGVAEATGARIYLVGGAVRDLMLGRPVEDVDLVVEGDGIAVARQLAERTGGRCHPHEPFMTAVIRLPGDHSVDVASARTEFYRAPAALPEVATSLIRQDLYRRDFTVNALAVSLNDRDFGALIDFFGGRRDLAQREIRVLHSLSFIDDPTRAIRAVRYARRLRFSLAGDTRHLIATAVSEEVFDQLSGPRVRKELEQLLAEDHPAGGLEVLAGLGLLAALEPTLRWDGEIQQLVLEVESQAAWARLEDLGEPSPLILYLGAVALRSTPESPARLVDRLHLTGARRAPLVTLADSVASLIAAAESGHALSHLARAVEEASLEALLVAMASVAIATRRRLAEAAQVARSTVVPVSGSDLIQAGIPPGPQIGRAIQETRWALVDRRIGPDEALDFAVRRAAGSGAGSDS